jgi:hypothetical protein
MREPHLLLLVAEMKRTRSRWNFGDRLRGAFVRGEDGPAQSTDLLILARAADHFFTGPAEEDPVSSLMPEIPAATLADFTRAFVTQLRVGHAKGG